MRSKKKDWEPGQTYNGVFWRADEPDITWPGTLERLDDGQLHLHVTPPNRRVGMLFGREAKVCGRLESYRWIALTNCTGTSGRYIHPEETLEAWFDTAVIGSETTVKADDTLRRTAIWLSDLNGWIDRRSFHFDKDATKKPPKVKITERRPIILMKENPTVSIKFTWRGQIGFRRWTEAVDIEGGYYVWVEHSSLTVQDLRWEIDTLQRFFSLCIGSPNLVQRVETSASTESVERYMMMSDLRSLDAELLDIFIQADKRPTTLAKHEKTFAFDALRRYLPKVYDNFRALAKRHPLYIETLMTPYFNTTMPEELQFTMLSFAAEGFHRETKGGLFVPKAEYRSRYMKPLRGLVPRHGNDELEEAISSALGHLNQKSFRARMSEFVSDLPSKTKRRFFDSDEKASLFLRKLADTRNYLAHREPELEPRSFKGHELGWGLQQLHALLVCNLFRSCGLPESLLTRAADRMLSRGRIYWGFKGGDDFLDW